MCNFHDVAAELWRCVPTEIRVYLGVLRAGTSWISEKVPSCCCFSWFFTTAASLLKAFTAGGFQVGSFSRWKPVETPGWNPFWRIYRFSSAVRKAAAVMEEEPLFKGLRHETCWLAVKLGSALPQLAGARAVAGFTPSRRRCRCFSQLQLRWDLHTRTAGTCLGFVLFVLKSRRTFQACFVLSVVKNSKRGTQKKMCFKKFVIIQIDYTNK